MLYKILMTEFGSGFDERDTLQVIMPHKAHSAGTIISLEANEIVMTKQALIV